SARGRGRRGPPLPWVWPPFRHRAQRGAPRLRRERVERRAARGAHALLRALPSRAVQCRPSFCSSDYSFVSNYCRDPQHTPSLFRTQHGNGFSMLNTLRTGLLIAALTAIFMTVGYVVGGTGGMTIALGIAVVTNFIGYWNADKLVLSLQNAEEVDPRRAPELYRTVERLARNAGIPT